MESEFAARPEGRQDTFATAHHIQLEGSLLAVNWRQEAILATLLEDWRVLPRLLAARAAGGAALTELLAARWRPDPATLPYNHGALDELRRRHSQGHRLSLHTTARLDQGVVIARHLGIFSTVVASGGSVELTDVPPASVIELAAVDPRAKERRLVALVRALRAYQWIKNALCVVPVLGSG